MPSPNTVKEYSAPAYYHIYNRGAGSRIIFVDDTDRQKFMSILERHLSLDLKENSYNVYDVELVAYCLMENHFHLLVYIPNIPRELTDFMKSVATAYSMYFNLRHKSSGHLFQGIYKASRIDNDPYLLHISRYIHLNPADYQTYPWSSLKEYLGTRITSWINPNKVFDITSQEYLEFLEDYEDRKKLLKSISRDLSI